MDKRENVLVTGGSGFIGNNLCRLLSATGQYNVFNFDVMRPSKKTMGQHMQPPVENTQGIHTEYIQGDINNPDDLEKAYFANSGFQYVIHLAAVSRVEEANNAPEHCRNTNIGGTFNVLRIAAQWADVTKRVIFTSSSAVYGSADASRVTPLKGEPKIDPYFAVGDMLHCKGPYAMTKLAGEALCDIFTANYPINIIQVRPFNVFGDGSPSTGPYAPVVQKFIEQRLKGESITICGDGENTRDYIHVFDVANAYITLLTTKVKDIREATGALNGTFNIGSGVAWSVNKIVAKVIQHIQSPEPHPKPFRQIDARDEPKHTLSDCTPLRSLGWRPVMDLETYIQAQARGV